MLFCNINEAFNITNINDTSTAIIDNSSIEKFVETEIQKPIVKKEKPKEKINLTHRQCLSVYFNPDHSNEQLLECALKHIHKCDLCKKHITNQQIKNQKMTENFENQKISDYKLQSDIKEDSANQYKSIIEIQQDIIKNLNNKLEEKIENAEDKQTNPLFLVHIIIGILLVFDILVRIKRY